MRIVALYDSNGTILAATMHDGRDRGPVPAPRDGQQLGIFDVPDSCHHMRLDEICTSMRIDSHARRLVDTKQAAP